MRTRQQLIYDTTEAYFAVLRAKAAVRIAEDSLESAQQQENLAEGFYQQELIPLNDVLRARVQRVEFKQQLISARNSRKLAIAALNRQMGIHVSSDIEVLEAGEVVRPEVSLENSLRQAVDNRPEFKAIQYAIAASQAEAKSVRAEFLPEIYAAGRLSHFSDSGLLDGTRTLGDVGIRLELFTGGRRLAQTRQAERRLESSIDSARQVADAIALQVQQAVLGIEDAWARLEVAEIGTEAAMENRRLVQGQFREELASSVDVADAEAAATRALQNQAGAKYDYLQSIERLKFAVGLNGPEY